MSPLVAAGSPVSSRTVGSTNSNPRHSTPPPMHVPLNNNNNNSNGWSASCLRPPPPLRPCLALGITPNTSSSCSGRKPTTYKEDAMILDVIEAYCSAVKPRSTVNSGRFHN